MLAVSCCIVLSVIMADVFLYVPHPTGCTGLVGVLLLFQVTANKIVSPCVGVPDDTVELVPPVPELMAVIAASKALAEFVLIIS